MGFFENKQALWLDLDRGITGSFVTFKDDTAEKNFVYPVITPFNSLRKITYASPVPKSAITTIYPSTQHRGVENEWMVVYEGSEQSLVKFIDRKFAQKVKELEELKDNLEIENRTLKQELIDAREGIQKSMRNAKELTKGSQPAINERFGNQHRALFDDLN